MKPIAEWADEALVQELGTALRHVAMAEHELPNGGDDLNAALARVRAAQSELRRRSVALERPLEELSSQTHWQMADLLEDSLGYPDRLPYIREEDGIRRRFRCHRCRQREFPEDDNKYWHCDRCLSSLLKAVEQLETSPELILYRTYSDRARCGHADDDTVLVALDLDYEFALDGVCAECIRDELRRRGAV